MSGDLFISLLAATILAGTPLLYATLGEMLTERSGVLNLGVEGMMLLGAFFAFFVEMKTGNHWLAVLAAGLGTGCIGLLRRWLDDGMLLPAGELAQLAENIMMRGLAFLQEEG